jgi:hypothetical protein
VTSGRLSILWPLLVVVRDGGLSCHSTAFLLEVSRGRQCPGALVPLTVPFSCSKLLHLPTLLLPHYCEHGVWAAATGPAGSGYAALCDTGPSCPGTGAG